MRLSGVFQADISRVRIKVRNPCDLQYKSWYQQEIRSAELGVCLIQLFIFDLVMHNRKSAVVYKFHENRMIFR